MPNLPRNCEYPACECTYPHCVPKHIRDAEKHERWREERETQREINYIDQRTQDYHEWCNRDANYKGEPE